MKINVQVKDKSWTNYLNKPHLLVKKKVSLLHKRFKNLSKKKILVTLVLSNSKEIKKLNKKFRGKNKSTDIISFPYNERSNLEKDMMNNNIDYLGDIIINIKKVKKKNFANNFDKLWIHGLLHLFGHTHKNDKDYKKMSQLEKTYFQAVS